MIATNDPLRRARITAGTVVGLYGHGFYMVEQRTNGKSVFGWHSERIADMSLRMVLRTIANRHRTGAWHSGGVLVKQTDRSTVQRQALGPMLTSATLLALAALVSLIPARRAAEPMVALPQTNN